MPKTHPIETPQDVRLAILASLHERDATIYGFAKAMSRAGFMRHHTVDSVLADPESASASMPTLSTAISLLDAAGYDLIAVKKREGIKIDARRRGKAYDPRKKGAR